MITEHGKYPKASLIKSCDTALTWQLNLTYARPQAICMSPKYCKGHKVIKGLPNKQYLAIGQCFAQENTSLLKQTTYLR